MVARNSKLEPVPSSSDFIVVCEAAKAGNEELLNGLIEKNILCIDVQDSRGLFTPAAALAAEGKHAAVQLLQKLGANPDYIAMGYAIGGYTKEAEEYRNNTGINIKHLVVGAAMYHDHTYADYLRKLYNLSPEWLIFGAALMQDDAYIKTLMSDIRDTKVAEKSICAKIKGLVMGGNITAASEILNSLYRTKSDTSGDGAKEGRVSDVPLKIAIAAAARIANEEALNRFLFINGDNEYLLDGYYQAAAIGAAAGGHIARAKELFEKTNRRENQLELVVKAAIKHGHFKNTAKIFDGLLKSILKIRDPQQDLLFHRLTLPAVLRGQHNHLLAQIRQSEGRLSALSTNYNDLATLMARHGNVSRAAEIFSLRNIIPIDVFKAMDQGERIYNEKLLIYTLAFIENPAFIKALGDAATTLSSMPSANKSKLSNVLGWNCNFHHKCFADFKKNAARASAINAAMKTYHFTFDQAEIFTKSQTVQKFLYLFSFRGKGFLKNLPIMLPEARQNGLSDQEIRDMAEKYMCYYARLDALRKFDAYINNTHTIVGFFGERHGNRDWSMRDAYVNAKARDELLQETEEEIGNGNGTIIVLPNPSLPKHKQPFDHKPAPDGPLLTTLEEIKKSPRLNN